LILLVDAGNSRIKWRLHPQGRIQPSGDIATASCGRLGEAWQGLRAKAACVCSVAGIEVDAILRHGLGGVLAGSGEKPHWLIAPAQGHGVENLYQPADSLGCDRFAALVAARHRRAVDWLVVNVGTAMTVDMLTAEGRFIGGAIVPGPVMMRTALHQGTAGVRAEAPAMDPAWPRNTQAAVDQGIAWALWGVVEGMSRQLLQTVGRRPRILLAGGGRAALRPLLPSELVETDELVLEGLTWIARDLGYDA